MDDKQESCCWPKSFLCPPLEYSESFACNQLNLSVKIDNLRAFSNALRILSTKAEIVLITTVAVYHNSILVLLGIL